MNSRLRAAATAAGGGSSDGLMDDVGSFGGDVAALASLQSQLAAADARASLVRAVPALAGMVLATLLAVAAAVAIVAGTALWVAERYGLETPAALTLTGVAALVLAALVGAACAKLLGRSVTPFRRSVEELERNIAWVKTTLVHSGR